MGCLISKKGMLFGSKGQEDENGRFFAEITKDENGITGYTADELGNCITKKITLSGYDEILKYGDDVISVHIPADGPLDYEYSEQSYDKTMRIVRECYPEYDIKAFVCWSWLMSKEIKQIMGRDTNITRFSNEYHVYPTLSQAVAVYAQLQNIRMDKVDDVCRVDIDFKSGIKAQVIADLWCYVNEARWHLEGSDGSAIIDKWFEEEGKIICAKNQNISWEEGCVSTPNGISTTMWPRATHDLEELPLPTLDKKPRWEEYYENIIAVMDGKSEPIVTHNQIRNDMKVLMAAFESSRTNQVVKL